MIIDAGTVIGTFDNISSYAGIDVTYNPTDVVLTITSPCLPIVPSVSQWGLVALRLFLLGAGNFAFGRRRVPAALRLQ